MKREDGRSCSGLWETAGETVGQRKGHDGADGGSVKGEVPVSMVEHLLSLDETAWYSMPGPGTRWKAGFPGNRSWRTRLSGGRVRAKWRRS